METDHPVGPIENDNRIHRMFNIENENSKRKELSISIFPIEVLDQLEVEGVGQKDCIISDNEIKDVDLRCRVARYIKFLSERLELVEWDEDVKYISEAWVMKLKRKGWMGISPILRIFLIK
jgi:hypothetical protein